MWFKWTPSYPKTVWSLFVLVAPPPPAQQGWVSFRFPLRRLTKTTKTGTLNQKHGPIFSEPLETTSGEAPFGPPNPSLLRSNPDPAPGELKGLEALLAKLRREENGLVSVCLILLGLIACWLHCLLLACLLACLLD